MNKYTFVVSPETPVSIEKVGEATWRGQINRIKWERAESVAAEISALITSCFPNVSTEVDCEFSADESQLESGLVIQIISEMDLLLEPILVGFLSRITETSINQDLFLNLEESVQASITKHSEDFLARLGNKIVGVPLKIRGDDFEFRVAGRFSDPPRSLPQIHSPFEFLAKINGFMKRERTLSLISEADGSLIVTTFDLNEFMRQIVEAALHDSVHNFTIQPKENEKGNLRNSLIQMSEPLEAETLC